VSFVRTFAHPGDTRSPAQCRVRVRGKSVLLDQQPSLLTLRGRTAVVVRVIHRCRVGGGASSCPDAGHRPPLKLHGRFSRMQLSRRLKLPGCQRRKRCNQVNRPGRAVELPDPSMKGPCWEPVRLIQPPVSSDAHLLCRLTPSTRGLQAPRSQCRSPLTLPIAEADPNSGDPQYQ
jgi:hypothetical protein